MIECEAKYGNKLAAKGLVTKSLIEPNTTMKNKANIENSS